MCIGYSATPCIARKSRCIAYVCGQCFFQTYSRGESPLGNFCWYKFLNVVPALLVDTVVFYGVFFNVAARCDFRAQNTPKCVGLCGRGFAPDPTGELTELPDPLAGFQEADSRQGRGRKGRGREGRRKREGVASPTSFFTI